MYCSNVYMRFVHRHYVNIYIYNTSCVSDGWTLCVKIDDGRVKLIYLLVLLTIPLLKFKALKIDISVCLFSHDKEPSILRDSLFIPRFTTLIKFL